MVRSQLNSYSGSDPIWGFVALIGSERFTGEAAVGLDPRVRLFAVDGRVYFAEREGDAPISTRLVNCGAVTTTQLEHGSVRIGEVTSLARLFQREPGIDRDAVELTIEHATESLLATIANKAVGLPEVFPLRLHASGIHHWLRAAAGTNAPVALPTVETPATDEPADGAVAAPAAESTFVAEPIVAAPEPVFVAEPLAVAEPIVVTAPEPVFAPEPVEPAAPSWPSLTAAEPVVEPIAEPVVEPIVEPEVEAVVEAVVEPAAEPVIEAVVVEPTVAEQQPEPTVAFASLAEPEDVPPAPEQPVAADEPLWQPTWQPRVPTLTSLEPEPEAAAAPAATFDPFEEPEVPVAPAASLPGLTPWSPAAAIDTPTEQIATIDEPVTESSEAAALEPAAVEAATESATSTFAPLPMLGSLNGSLNGSHHGSHHESSVVEPPAMAPDMAEEAPAAAPSLPSMPTLGSLTPLAPLNGHHVDEAPAIAPQAPTAADLLGSLDSLTAAPPAHDLNPYEPGELPTGLPKLASAPISMDDIGTNGTADPSGPWGGPAHNHAAVGIWEMVDDLLDDGKPMEQDLVGSGVGEKRRGWLRGKKG